jgi:hypothetical protein
VVLGVPLALALEPLFCGVREIEGREYAADLERIGVLCCPRGAEPTVVGRADLGMPYEALEPMSLARGRR